jgi:peptidoglycan-N-acetylmuramic acid deacetylase
MDSSKPKALYLTFDEGYENGYTASILDTLKKCGVPAAFFITGPYAKTETELVQRMIDEGHTLGNHTVNHPNLPKLSSSEKMIKELDDLNSIVTEKYGVEMKYMRPPEGEWSERLLAAAQSAGYKTILWSFAYRDWDTKTQKGADYAFEQVTPYLHNGAILLLHAVSSDNAAALERIIEYAKSEGYEFRSLDELHPNN